VVPTGTSKVCENLAVESCHHVSICQVFDRTAADAKGEEGCCIDELHRAIIYTTKMSKQVTKSDAVHMYP
jgi:hypothetical protein